MVNEYDHQADNFAGSPRKSYSAMKVSQLGDLAGLTEAMVNRPYADMLGGTMMTRNPNLDD
jgi:hypothetical protein